MAETAKQELRGAQNELLQAGQQMDVMARATEKAAAEAAIATKKATAVEAQKAEIVALRAKLSALGVHDA